MERKGIVTIKGSPLTLLGPEIRVGDKAPDFTVIDRELREVSLKDFAGKIKLFSITPSLDTPVCDSQARRFNEEVSKLPGDIVVINISMDLPFAIGRFCSAAGIDKVKIYSDHREGSFGKGYGVLIKELRLLARSIFIIGMDDTVRHVEIVPEVTHPVNYEKALAFLI